MGSDAALQTLRDSAEIEVLSDGLHAGAVGMVGAFDLGDERRDGADAEGEDTAPDEGHEDAEEPLAGVCRHHVAVTHRRQRHCGPVKRHNVTAVLVGVDELTFAVVVEPILRALFGVVGEVLIPGIEEGAGTARFALLKRRRGKANRPAAPKPHKLAAPGSSRSSRSRRLAPAAASGPAAAGGPACFGRAAPHPARSRSRRPRRRGTAPREWRRHRMHYDMPSVLINLVSSSNIQGPVQHALIADNQCAMARF